VPALKWTEEYFVHKCNTNDAVKLARDGQQYTPQIQQALDASDFYKPLTRGRIITRRGGFA
jgi:hypothetical protein